MQLLITHVETMNNDITNSINKSTPCRVSFSIYGNSKLSKEVLLEEITVQTKQGNLTKIEDKLENILNKVKEGYNE